MILGAEIGNDVACLTDGRFSGGTHGFCLSHVVPKVVKGGPIGLLKDGDVITIDAEANTLEVALTEEELKTRRIGWKSPPEQVTSGTLYKYQQLVSDASHGAVTGLLDIKDLSLCGKAQ
ncbi:hypothetical protein PSHT_15758 [Puccinia striiformis]|uniref:Dihydroxy-acid/6-phosphogluconate dehydratase C-terminal domain-containing protein n=2 Tax=Puccinia striiformis TaxID=27350 RepID=A0A0L0VBN4_9BASI|nr:hypothetical protein Pst134EB_021884 [Puccinia striiformis f. sp. tritici]KNE96690.1 hypothetical protein PSTG_10093 [Puccinia striiformis f. sp. tritici PST-78]POV95257.1 hypothetical protein PSHT_15758 [Puccinia striiformis]